jgi:peptidoglycan hydrolase CwlO-like protein
MGRPTRASRRSVLVGTIVAVLALSLAAPAGAASLGDLHRAKAKLHVLTDRIRVRQQALADSQARYERLQQDIDRVVRRLAAIHRQAREVRDDVAALEARLAALTERLNQLANTSYMHQPGGQLGMMLGILMGSESISELTQGMEFATRIAGQTATLAAQVMQTRARLASRLSTLRSLASEKSQLLATLTEQRRRVHRLNVQREHALRLLMQTQRQVIDVVRHLRIELAAELFPLVGSAFQGGAHTSYGRWGVLFLRTLGAPVCRSNEIAMVAWQLAEFTQAAWNPLATTKPMPGSTAFNTAGVQNYSSLETGLLANKLTLYHGWSSYGYGAIVNALRSCASPFTTARAVQASSWCHGCAGGGYVVNKVGEVAANFRLYASF